MTQPKTARPQLTISQAATEFDVSRSTLKRGLESGRYAGAEKDTSGAWRIPVEALHQEHKPRASPHQVSKVTQAKTLAQTPLNQDQDLTQKVRDLEQALAIEQAERRAAERVAEAEARRAETAERALLMIESGAQQAGATQGAPTGASEVRTAEPRGGRVARFFSRR